jgi:uncharacterized membrane protein HdeD (DUF308 family)
MGLKPLADRMNLILGVVLIVLGILVLTGNIYLGPIVTVAGILLIVVGVLMLINRLPGGTVLAVVAIVLGALLLIPNNVMPEVGARVLQLTIGVILLVYGILKVAGK